MNTQPLYLDDSYTKEFDALVLQSGPKYAVLDKTAFYPEGGGQPSDTGVLKWDGKELSVFRALKRGKQIFHYLEGNIPEGVEVRGKIDWDQRFWNMRRHSAEHLLTGLIEGRGISPKVFSNLERLEYVDEKVSEKLLEDVSTEFDSIVKAGVSVETYYEKRENVDIDGDPRKKAFLENIPRNIEFIRMVEIGKYSLTFCMGTHVETTTDIGKLTVLTLEKARKGKRIVKFLLERDASSNQPVR